MLTKLRPNTHMLTNNKLILLLFICFMLGVLLDHFISSSRVSQGANYVLPSVSNQNAASTLVPVTSTSHVEVVNLNQSVNATFKCMKTKTLLNYFHSHICVHDSQKDVYVSNSFKEGASIWEEEGVVRILQMLLRNPHLDFIDIGANIGTYTMYAAAVGRFVLAIECFGPNVQRIHRAIQLANVANRVVLVQNALYTQSGQYLRLGNDAINVGGQELDVAGKSTGNQTVKYNQTSASDPYIVKTIRFDDLVPILVARGIRGAIVKVDIEGSESFVVEGGSQVFDLIDIPMIQIEWLKIREFPDRVKTLVDFFVKHQYEPKSFQCQPLNFSQISTWPNDFCWTKKNVTFC